MMDSPSRRRTATFTVILIIVAGFCYGLGRKHGAAKREVTPPPAAAPVEKPAATQSQATAALERTLPLRDASAVRTEIT